MNNSILFKHRQIQRCANIFFLDNIIEIHYPTYFGPGLMSSFAHIMLLNYQLITIEQRFIASKLRRSEDNGILNVFFLK